LISSSSHALVSAFAVQLPSWPWSSTGEQSARRSALGGSFFAVRIAA
jgi:hypothetical protein